ncbi:MAG: NAD(P)(+) transhydrogenase (Re/Si-specific) subunit beta [Flavobacteriales bacterium]|nr:NAD(P)(+) transhydrogenase (Re/Si-specific) subunit beta [Flavobacteriales bacterium]
MENLSMVNYSIVIVAQDKSSMLFGDAKKVLTELVGELKTL